MATRACFCKCLERKKSARTTASTGHHSIDVLTRCLRQRRPGRPSFLACNALLALRRGRLIFQWHQLQLLHTWRSHLRHGALRSDPPNRPRALRLSVHCGSHQGFRSPCCSGPSCSCGCSRLLSVCLLGKSGSCYCLGLRLLGTHCTLACPNDLRCLDNSWFIHQGHQAHRRSSSAITTYAAAPEHISQLPSTLRGRRELDLPTLGLDHGGIKPS
mmetsp:Transcript_72893/g.126570  ORF Transcript_72893/g.126570 Transcript_72893/m.126570 type:complete len:215 (-) Transcript_72893:290-934(-)